LDEIRRLAFINISRVINWRKYKNESKELLNKCFRKQAQMIREPHRHNYRIDLHGYNPSDSILLVNEIMYYFMHLTCFPHKITFIVGRGSHSDNGYPVISKKVEDFLRTFSRISLQFDIGTITAVRKRLK
jgi:hypothetical protein